MDAKPSLGKQMLKSIPAVMRMIRQEMRPAAAGELSIPQFRILAHLSPGQMTISTLADLQGVSLPAMSKMLDGLCERHFVRKKACHDDRRTQWIELLPKGRKIFEKMQGHVEVRLNHYLRRLSPNQIKVLEEAMLILYAQFAERRSGGAMEVKNAL